MLYRWIQIACKFLKDINFIRSLAEGYSGSIFVDPTCVLNASMRNDLCEMTFGFSADKLSGQRINCMDILHTTIISGHTLKISTG